MLFLVTMVPYRIRKSFLSKDQLQKLFWYLFFSADPAEAGGIFWRKEFFCRAFPKRTPRRIDVNLTSILRRCVKDQTSTNFYVISAYFFDVISLIEKSMPFPHTFFNVISMVEKSRLLPRTFFDVILTQVVSTYFFDVISLIKKFTVFPRTFYDVIYLVEISTVFLLTFFNVILMVEKSTLFARTFFDEIWMGPNSTAFLVGCKVMKTFEEVFLR